MGEPISGLKSADLPLGAEDYIEISRPRAGDPTKYDSFKAPASALAATQATVSNLGIAELATSEEAVLGQDPERVITPAALEAALLDLLENRIIAGTGIDLDFTGGVLTISAV